MSQYTPGPWTVRIWATEDDPEKLRKMGLNPVPALDNDGHRAIWAGEDKVVALIKCQTIFKRGKGYLSTCDEREANARLIAAAPELVEALKDLLAFFDKEFPNGWNARVAREAQDALAHATGEQA